MKYYLITGASKGLGAALALALAEREVTLITCSRSGLDETLKLALIEKGAIVKDFKADLSQQNELSRLAREMMASVDKADATDIILYNNAGRVTPIAPFQKADDEEVMANITLNYTAPMILSRHFGMQFGKLNLNRRIITVSSGAGKRPFFGWNSYCASKAAIDMMTRVIGLEEGEQGILAISFGPGIMDTDMQGEIRSSDEDSFKDVAQFKDFKTNGDLLAPEVVAAVLARLSFEKIDQGALVNVKDFL